MGVNAVCVHAHFYQPPREDPLSGLIPDENGAEPFKNWNERIHSECYKPNADLGNFAKVSFNFGPTIFRWMEVHDPLTYRAIIAQERSNYERFGVGNGLAQAYNHVILPLASSRDKVTQIQWGIADFKHRFGHDPDGMWLPETAVDLETLSLMADHKIRFTVLAPWQIEDGERLSGQEPYLINLPGGREPMIVFLYQQGLSTAVSFQNAATRNADRFVEDWVQTSFSAPNGDGDRMVLIASDGELYGHHKTFRDKFLAQMLNGALHNRGLEITYPGLWLQTHSPGKVVALNEYTSWSCQHGITRWMGECGCTPGASWKAPLRWGMEKLAEALDLQFQTYMNRYTRDVWGLRNAYIHAFLGDMTLNDLLKEYISQPLNKEERSKIGMLLGAQYERQRIFTSCGWFFENFHRIEPQNNIAYTAQAIWLTKKVTGKDLQPHALALLKKVKDQKTGLRGDIVFAEKYQRMQAFSEDELPYFNPASSFST